MSYYLLWNVPVSVGFIELRIIYRTISNSYIVIPHLHNRLNVMNVDCNVHRHIDNITKPMKWHLSAVLMKWPQFKNTVLEWKSFSWNGYGLQPRYRLHSGPIYFSRFLVLLETVGSHRISTRSTQLSMDQHRMFWDLACKNNSDETNDFVFSSCHICVLEWICTLQLS